MSTAKQAVAVAAPPQPAPPAFAPKRTLPAATTWADVTRALAALQPGDRLPVSGVQMPKTATFSKRLTGAAELVFDSSCKFNVAKGTLYGSVEINNAAHLRLISKGPVVSNPALGLGVDIIGAQNCVLDGFDVRNCASAAMSARPLAGEISGNYIRATVRDWALVPSLDDHPEKGTGLHGLLVETSHTPHNVTGNTFVLTTPGSRMGSSLLEVGSANPAIVPTGNRAWLHAENLLQNAQMQTAGNALNLWGRLGTLDVVWVYAAGLHGFAVHSSPYAPYGGVKVESGYAAGCCLNPRYRGQLPWQHNGGVWYGPVVTG